jgi:hypothetical protein
LTLLNSSLARFRRSSWLSPGFGIRKQTAATVHSRDLPDKALIGFNDAQTADGEVNSVWRSVGGFVLSVSGVAVLLVLGAVMTYRSFSEPRPSDLGREPTVVRTEGKRIDGGTRQLLRQSNLPIPSATVNSSPSMTYYLVGTDEHRDLVVAEATQQVEDAAIFNPSGNWQFSVLLAGTLQAETEALTTLDEVVKKWEAAGATGLEIVDRRGHDLLESIRLQRQIVEPG